MLISGDPPEAAWLLEHLRLALSELGIGGEVRLRIVDDAEMSAIHGQWLGEASTTDVVTFDLAEGDSSRTRELDADLVLCRDEAQRNADRLGHEPRRELLLYALHGVLHCLGHDDHEEASARAMHALEDEILARIGVGPTFAPGTDA